jgi:hypothetical protein
MSDSRMAKQATYRIVNPLYAMVVFAIIIALHLVMSNTAIGDASVLPYDEGGKEDIPSAAARICNLRCSRVPSGYAFTFDLEVFETSWAPVYALEIEGLSDAVVEPAAWPEGWKAGTAPSSLTQPGSMVFYTVDDPVMPGSVRYGFGIVSYSGGAALRWFPADDQGILIGKASRLDLSCPVGTEPETWGSIKALYR